MNSGSKTSSLWKLVPVAGVSVTVGAIAGGALLAHTVSADESNSGEQTALEQEADVDVSVDDRPSPEYDVNDQGETFGYASDARTLDEEPDLIRAIADDGQRGYVRGEDLYQDPPATPEEAVEYMENDEYLEPRVVPVYESDGVTVIGTFTMSPGEAEMVEE